MDALQAQQIAAFLAMTGQQFAGPNPNSAAAQQSAAMLDAAQAGVAAEAQKKAEKKAKKKQNKGIGRIVGSAAAVAAAPFTGGTSLAFLPAAAQAGDAIESGARGNWMGAAGSALGAVGQGYGGWKSTRPPAGAPDLDSDPQAMLGPEISPPPAGASMGAPDPMFGKTVQSAPIPPPGAAAPPAAPAAAPGIPAGQGQQRMTMQEAQASGLSEEQIGEMYRQGLIVQDTGRYF